MNKQLRDASRTRTSAVQRELKTQQRKEMAEQGDTSKVAHILLESPSLSPQMTEKVLSVLRRIK
jgi:hypothetical protein